MAVRFRKSIKLAPGIRMNLSGSGLGWTLGPRGASVGISSRGTRVNTSFAGFSASHQISRPKRAVRTVPAVTASQKVSMTCKVADDGQLIFLDSNGAPVPDHLVALAKQQHKEGLQKLIQSKCDDINAEVESVAEVHLETPNSNQVPRFSLPTFETPQPTQPTPLRLRFLDKVFKKRRHQAEEAHRRAMGEFEQEALDWQAQKAAFARTAEERRDLIERRIYSDTAAMETWLGEVLSDIAWPRETEVAFEVLDEGRTVMLDVDLPEVEDMPSKIAAVPARGMKLSVKDLTSTKVQKLYMEHIHAVVFRLIGEVFAALPLAKEVVISGYSQRHNAGTGRLQDDYLLSVQVRRDDWNQIDFDHLDQIQVTESLSRFDLRRTMSKTGVFKAIEPFGRE
ncbi:DUF4236 domain-containing protein [Cupriavidus sp. AcVe19-6a]|uniref:DUF4236 domain-containing protein n=1 Tax=Cupriavidus sp. AcVe19-6a TaxID=2821358 RepID=UPI001AE476C2|nr:DUF4236 domain-containing protein [Cupriavidus sp. AcVe19-6a]MBP0639720.1 DUF4236 domain-containing protein [Cupriavidus sp. AcVe19-6a]